MDTVTLTVWSDFLCPWCYVAAVRLALLQREYGDRLTIVWRSFLLQPDPTPKPVDRFRRYTERWLRPGGPGSVESDATFVVWNDETPPTHSLPPAIAGKAAASFGAESFERFHLALMHAYFSDHRDVSSGEVVKSVAGSVGIDEAEFARRLQVRGAEFHKAVLDDHAEALDTGIHAVPTVVLNGSFPIPGAQELDTYRRFIDRVSASSS